MSIWFGIMLTDRNGAGTSMKHEDLNFKQQGSVGH